MDKVIEDLQKALQLKIANQIKERLENIGLLEKYLAVESGVFRFNPFLLEVHDKTNILYYNDGSLEGKKLLKYECKVDGNLGTINLQVYFEYYD